MQKENWYFLLTLVLLLACIVGGMYLTEEQHLLGYCVGFITGIITCKFFVFSYWDSKVSNSLEGKRICEAVQYGDSMVCPCGNHWDTNDSNRPPCQY